MAEQADRWFLCYFMRSISEENNAAVGVFPVPADSSQEAKMIPVRQLNKYEKYSGNVMCQTFRLTFSTSSIIQLKFPAKAYQK